VQEASFLAEDEWETGESMGKEMVRFVNDPLDSARQMRVGDAAQVTKSVAGECYAAS
jgi:hypothetical protein